MNSFFSNRKKIIWLISICLILTCLILSTVGNYVSAADDSDVDVYLRGSMDIDYTDEILILINSEREKAGIGPLTMSQDLVESADIRARECILRYSHERPVSEGWTSLISPGFLHAGENLAIGYNSAEEAVSAWMASPSHKANILQRDYKTTGIGVFKYTNLPTGKIIYTCAQHFSNAAPSGSYVNNKEEYSYSVRIDTDIYPLEFDLFLEGYDHSQLIDLSTGNNIDALIKVRGNEIFGEEYIAADLETLKWEIDDPHVVSISEGAIHAGKPGETAIRISSTDKSYETELNIRVKKSICNAEIEGIVPQPYCGKTIEPDVVVKDEGAELVEGKDYKVRYSDNMFPGTAKIHIIGTGDYGSESIIYFSVYDESTVMKESLFKKILRFFGVDL